MSWTVTRRVSSPFNLEKARCWDVGFHKWTGHESSSLHLGPLDSEIDFGMWWRLSGRELR